MFFSAKSADDPNKLKVNLYFLNPMTGKLEPEVRYVEKGENKDVAKNVLNMLFEGPKNSSLVKSLPANVKPFPGKLVSDTETILEVEFSKEYKEIAPYDELFFRGSLVWTMTSLDFIDSVHIYVDGEELLSDAGKPIGLLNRNNVMINENIPAEKVAAQWVKLYFTDASKEKLVAEERLIEEKDKNIEESIVLELIKGPATKGLFATVPPETLIREVREDQRVCYVNLSSEFLAKYENDEEWSKIRQLTIYSIVNSLTELTKVKSVRFLIESQYVTGIDGSDYDLSKSILRNEDLISTQ